MLRIGIGGIHIESSTFSPHRARLSDFTITRGQALLDRYDFTREDWGVEWVPLMHAVALPGGAVETKAYQQMKDELATRIAHAGPLDGLLYDIHGAMSVVGLIDAELDLTYAVRGALGSKPLVSAAMDLHGNVSRRFAEQLDLITAHRLAPHEDVWLTRERAARNLVERLRSGGRPHRAWVQVPVLLPGEKTSTRLEPAKGLYGSLAGIAEQPGIVDAAIWVGYAWADEPRCRAAIVVTGDDRDLVLDEAAKLAHQYWDARHDFVFVGPTGSADECIDRAVKQTARPFVLSDSGDNPTAGGAGDLPVMLEHLLANEELASGRVTAVHAGITDPAAVTECVRAGVGAEVTLRVGGKIDTEHGGPLPITGVVTGLQPDDQVGGDIAAVTVGGVTVILTSRRKPYHRIADFTAVGIDPHERDLVVVKIGYLEPELHDLAADWLLVLTPGGVDQDLARLGHHRVMRPLYPFDEFDGPDLTPRLL